MLSFRIATVAICALLPTLSCAAYIQAVPRFAAASGTACMRQCPRFDTSIGQNSRVGPRAGVEDETNTNTLCRYSRTETFPESNTSFLCRYSTATATLRQLITPASNLACPAVLTTDVDLTLSCGSPNQVYMGVTNTAGTIGSARLGDSGELRSGNNLRRCNFFFTKDSVESNTRCYYNSLDGVFVPELSGTQCTTSPAPRTNCATKRKETSLQRRIRERQYKGPPRQARSAAQQ